MWPLSLYVLMLLVSWHSAVAQMCTLPEIDDYQRLIVDTYTSVVVDEVSDAMYVCVSDDVGTATLAVKFSCIGQECEHSTVEAFINLRCSAGLWTTTGRIVTKISNIEQGSNCSICMNATERNQTYPDDERSTYSEENHCLIIHKCYTRTRCSGSFEKYVTNNECCLSFEDGLSYHTGDECKTCIVHGFGSDVYEVEEGGTVEIKLEANLKGTTNFPFLQVNGDITSDNSTDIEAIRLTVPPTGITFEVTATEDDIAAEDDSVILRFAHDFGPLFIERVIGAGEYFRDTATVRVIDTDGDYSVSMKSREIVVLEDVGMVEVCTILSSSSPLTFPLTHPVTVRLRTVDGISSSSPGPPEVPTPLDYDNLDTELRFLHSEMECVNITIKDDKAVELSTGPFREEFSVVLESNSNVVISGKSSTNIRIRDNDVVFAKPEYLECNITENDSSLNACAVIVPQPGQTCPFDFHAEISISTDAGTAGSTNDHTSDYDALSVMSPIPRCGFITCQVVTIRDDGVVEEDEIFFITLERAPIVPIGRIEFPMSRATVNLRDNDMAEVGLTQTVYDVAEDVGMVEVCVEIQHGSIAPSFHVNLTTTDGTANSPKHYTPVTQKVKFGQNDRETRKCINIEIKNVMDEYTVDGSVSFNVALVKPEDLPLGIELKPDRGVVRIADKEEAVFGMEVESPTVQEGGEVEACLVIFSPVNAQELCNITTVFEVSLLCSNCDVGECTSLRYEPENCNKDVSETSQCCRIPFEDDTRIEISALKFMLLRGPEQPRNIDIETPNVTVLYIDNDMAVVGFQKERYRVSEEEKEINVCVVIKSQAECPVSFSFELTLSTVEGSAEEGSDYIGYEDTVVFPSCHNITFDPVCRNIPIVNDTQAELLEMFTVTLTGNVHENIILDPSVTVVKIKDERIPNIGIEMEVYKVNENDGTLRVCVVTVASIPIEDCANQQFRLYSIDNTAKIGEEFSSVYFDMDFCINKTCVDVTILDDSTLNVEPSTSFDLILIRIEGDQQIDIYPDRARVDICDNEYKLELLKIQSVKSTSVEVSWRGNGQAPTTVRYDCIFKETGLVVSQSEVTMQPRVTSTVISVCVGDTVPEYQHKVTLIQKTPSGDDQVNKTFDLDEKYFQIQFGPVEYCINWEHKKSSHIEYQLQSHIVRIIRDRCDNCTEFSVSYLRQGMFLCYNNPTTATYRSALVSPFSSDARNSSYLLSILQDWISTAPSLTINWLLVRVNPICPTGLPRLDAAECTSGSTFLWNSGITEGIHAVLNQCVVEKLGTEMCGVR